jgi:hypothetical protein
MTLVKKFETPSEAVLDAPIFNKAILVLMYDLEDHLLILVG